MQELKKRGRGRKENIATEKVRIENKAR